MNSIRLKHHQQGITTVEFSIVGMVLFLVLFGLIEFGRLLFTWNVLDEATRRAARLAAVCPVSVAGQNFVRNAGAFGGDILPGFTADNIALSYWQEDGLTAATATDNTYYVRASIINENNFSKFPGKTIDDAYKHQFLVPIIGVFFDPDPNDGHTIFAPDFSTTLPAESLGVDPEGASKDICSL